MPHIEKVCQTLFGKFKIRIDDRNINVGGRTFCVNIALYEKETSLYWLKTDEGGCELNEKDIQGDNTVRMTDLAFSLLRKHYPERNGVVTLLDDSGFSWKDTKGKKYKTNFLKGYLLMNRKTWYEDKFGAVMCDQDIYKLYRERADNNFNDPTKKPESFDFMNRDVAEILDPLYKNSRTWGEFIQKIKDKYNESKYKLIYNWYRQAIYIIFEGMEINQDWKIDISQRPNIECDSGGGRSGGGRSGHTSRKNRTFTFRNYNRLEPFNWTP